MGDGGTQPKHLVTRLLPWVAAIAGIAGTGPFVGIASLAVALGLSYLLLLGVTLVARSGLFPGRTPPSLARVIGLYGAIFGAAAVTLWMFWEVSHDRSSTAALGFLTLVVFVPAGMVYFGALGWAVAALARRRSHPRSERTAGGFWIPWLVVIAIVGSAAAFFTWQRHFEARLQEAKSTLTSADRLAVLARDADLAPTVAANPSTSVETLRELARDASVRFRVAANRNAPPDLLTELAELEDARSALAWNTATPPEVLRMLSSSPRAEVRQGVAANRSTPEDVLTSLVTADPVPIVQDQARSELIRRGRYNPPRGVPFAPTAEPR